MEAQVVRQPVGRGSVESWHLLLAERGLKWTVTRRAIVSAFFHAEGHVSLMEIVQLARRGSRKVGLATVYRTMKLLEAAGLAERHEFDGEQTRYEVALGRDHHDHFICRGCGAILEFASPEIERLQEEVARQYGFDIQAHRHELYGVCARCRPAAAAAPGP